MPKNSNDRARLICLAGVFEKYSDEEHPLTVGMLMNMLAESGISVTRQTLYKDFEELSLWGYPVKAVRGREYGYYLDKRTFELAELKLMVDAVQSARFIDREKCALLIDKLGSLTSVHRALRLKRQVYAVKKKDADIGRIYENIDMIHEAISLSRKIRYKYYDWSPEKRRVARHNGAYYVATPVALIWDDENYYLVAYDEGEKKIKHFRVDKLGRVYMLEEPASRNETIEKLDLALYSEQVFGMYSGRQELVTLVCHNSLAGVIVDKFGQDVTFFREGAEHFSISVRVMVSPNFFSWILMFGSKIKIKAPASVVNEFKSTLLTVAKEYEG